MTPGPFRRSAAVFWLAALIAVLAAVAAASGLLWPDGGEPFSFTTLRGGTVEVYGRGLYEHDTVFLAAGNQGLDVVVLFLGVPLLSVSTFLYRRGSLRGALLLTGSLGYFLYVYASYALGAAYNELFLLYVALFSASLFAFVLAFAAFELRALPGHFAPDLPRRGPAMFLFAGGAVTLVVWAAPVVAALLAGTTPERLDSYTTMVTYALDLAVITPATFLSGTLILKRSPLGYVIASPLLVTVVLLGPQIVLGTLLQVRAGVHFPPAQIVGPIVGFAVLSGAGAWILAKLLRGISGSTHG